MTEDFALIDFALSTQAPAEIAEAIGRARRRHALNAEKRGRPVPAGKGFLSRLFQSGTSEAIQREAETTLLIQPPGTIDGPILRDEISDIDDTGFDSPVRLSGPLGKAELTLIEFRDDGGETSDFCSALSAELPKGDELFFFRHSGRRHPGALYAFQIYQNGKCTRSAVSSSAEGIAPEAAWIGVDAGMPHPIETDSLPPPGARSAQIMTPSRQGSILAAIGIDPDGMFETAAEAEEILELTDAPGGLPLKDASGIMAHRQAGPRVLSEVTSNPAARPAPTPAAPPPAAAVAPPVPEAPPAMVQPSQPAPVSAAGPKSPGAEAPGADKRRPMPWEMQVPAPSWEEEVTGILVAAVEDALPGPEQVAWLDALTQRLVAGDLDNALEEARAVIARGSRPEAEREADAKRLARLFGRRG